MHLHALREMSHTKRFLIVLVFPLALSLTLVSASLLPVNLLISSNGRIGQDSFWWNTFLQSFHTGADAQDTSPRWWWSWWGKGVTGHVGRIEGFTYMQLDGGLGDSDPFGKWMPISESAFQGQHMDLSVISLNDPADPYNLFQQTREVVMGEQINNPNADYTYLKVSNPSAYPLIPLYSLWIYNFEDITKSMVSQFLTKWSDYLKTLDVELQKAGESRRTWVMWEPAWEYNQDATSRTGTGWGFWGRHGPPDGYNDIPRGWNILPADYERQMKMIVDTRNELGIDNILIVSHALNAEFRDFTDRYRIQPYIPAIRNANVDVISFSAYNDDPVGTSFRRGKEWWDAIGGNKPLAFTEFNKENRPEDSAFLTAAYEALPQYPMVKFFSFWDWPASRDTGTHATFITKSANWDGYAGVTVNLTSIGA